MSRSRRFPPVHPLIEAFVSGQSLAAILGKQPMKPAMIRSEYNTYMFQAWEEHRRRTRMGQMESKRGMAD